MVLMSERMMSARRRWAFPVVFLLLLGLAPNAFAAPTPAQVNGADVAWLLTSAALVLMMTIPGLALFYGGLVRRKNVLSTLMHSFILVAVISIQWVLFGYSIAFAPGTPLFGSLHWVGLSGVSATVPYAAYSATVPHQAFMIYQCMFAIITPALITGAIAERMSFRGFLLFSILWATLIYDPIAHWIWGAGGWLHTMGALDFAGGMVVHVSSGTAALAGALVLGKRTGYPREPMPPHNVVLTVTGAGLLWVGWFGFNAGSALAATGLAVSAFVATHLGGSAAALGWLIAEWSVTGKPTVLGAASGAVAGLATITPAAGFVGPIPAIIIGLAAGVVCFSAVRMKPIFGYDDSLDVVGVHCVGGVLGVLLTGLFASVAVNPAGANGLFYGNPGQFVIQAVGVVATLAFSFVGTTVLLKITDALVGIRVTEDDEQMGLDLSQHNESAYAAEA
jgi:ammonium transporter, Amt family